MATYNGADYVAEQLKSILGQRLPPSEIVIGDDQSSDGPAQVVADIARSSPVPIHLVVNTTRLGHADNFLQTAVRATGDLIAFADQDDVWLPEKLSRAVPAFDDPAVSLWVHDRTMVGPDLQPLPERRLHTGIAKRASRRNPLHAMHGSRMVFRAEALRYFPGDGRARSIFGERPAEHDEWATFAAFVLGRVAWEPKSLILFRRHETTVGPGQAPSVREVLGAGDPTRYDAVVSAALSRAEYLEQRAETPLCQPARSEIIAAAAAYRRMIPRLRRRAANRSRPDRIGRAGGVIAAAARGDYLRGPLNGGLGTFALLQDSFHLMAR
jgi:glycosyltransferase involved in cell wall biosynthesis